MKIKEIAEKAGVSVGTVDRVLHNRGRVSQLNIEKIFKIVKEEGYEPNGLASRLRSQENYCFGVLIPELHSEFGYWQQVYSGVKSVEKELKSLQIKVVYFFYDRSDPVSFFSAFERMITVGVNAYIVAPLIPEMMEKAAETRPDIPFVFIDSSLPNLKCLADFSQNPETAGKVGAKIMKIIAPDLDEVFTFQTFHGAFNGRMRAEYFIQNFKKYNNIKVNRIIKENAFGLIPYFSKLSKDKKYGLFVVNDGAHAICEILRNMEIDHLFTVIGFDLSTYNRYELENGGIAVILEQRPKTQAHDAIMYLYKKFVLHIESEVEECPVDIYIKENMPKTDFWV